MIGVIWLSVDPVNKEINYYPKKISEKIEQKYIERDIYITSSCVLGDDFFNATVHFHQNGTCYQTTPGISMGRAGYKKPGYRSVKRIEINRDQTHIRLLIQQIHGEWRICSNQDTISNEINEEFDKKLIININNSIIENTSIYTWKPEDLDSEDLNKNVIVWQWCKGTYQNNNDIFRLPNNLWMSYDFNNTDTIEYYYKNNNKNVIISLPIIGERNIIFDSSSCYARQISLDGKKVRFVRRTVKTVKELNETFTNNSTPKIYMSSLLATLPDGSIPYHFNCCITQDIMNDPVKTIDGFIYERDAIEKWFQHKHTAPLTGLTLSSIVLEPCVELKKQIDEFKASLIK